MFVGWGKKAVWGISPWGTPVLALIQRITTRQGTIVEELSREGTISSDTTREGTSIEELSREGTLSSS